MNGPVPAESALFSRKPHQKLLVSSQISSVGTLSHGYPSLQDSLWSWVCGGVCAGVCVCVCACVYGDSSYFAGRILLKIICDMDPVLKPPRPGPLRVNSCSALKWERAAVSRSVTQFLTWDTAAPQGPWAFSRAPCSQLLFSSLCKAQTCTHGERLLLPPHSSLSHSSSHSVAVLPALSQSIP